MKNQRTERWISYKGTLAASILGKILTGEEVIRGSEGVIKAGQKF